MYYTINKYTHFLCPMTKPLFLDFVSEESANDLHKNKFTPGG